MPPSQKTAKLPAETEDHVIEVSLRHVILLFSLMALGTLFVGATLTIVKDYSKIKRQQAFFDNTKELLKLIQKGDKHEKIR